jgi:predicted Zn-dependent protease
MIKPLIRISLSLVATSLALLVITASAPAIGASAGTLKPHPTPANSASTIYFVPVGDVSSLSLDQLVGFYKQKFRLNIKTLPGLQLEKTGGFRQGRQFSAEDLIEFMKNSYPRHSRNPAVILIGITEEDIFIRKYSWQFAFSYRAANRFAVVSCARMNPVNFGQPANQELLHTRLRKMITKNIGILYYRLPQNNNPRSVMFSSILGVEELDRVGEDF